MSPINRFELPLAKAEYLLNFQTEPGQGGDKRRFWHEIIGFQSAEALRHALLAEISAELLQQNGKNEYGDFYRATIWLTGPLGLSCQIRMVWIVLFGQDVARFVTAYPDKYQRGMR